MGRLLSTQRLQRIMGRWRDNMDATVTRLPQTQTAGSGGETAVTYPDPSDDGLTTVPGRCRPMSQDEADAADQLRGRAGWRVAVPVGTGILPSDRLSVAGTDGAGTAYTKLLEVVGVDGPATWQAVEQVTCWELVPDAPLEA